MEVSVNHPFYFGILKYKPSSYWDPHSHMRFPQEAIDRSDGPDGADAQAAGRCQKGPARIGPWMWYLGSPKNWNVGFSNPQSEIANMIDIGYWIFIMNISERFYFFCLCWGCYILIKKKFTNLWNMMASRNRTSFFSCMKIWSWEALKCTKKLITMICFGKSLILGYPPGAWWWEALG